MMVCHHEVISVNNQIIGVYFKLRKKNMYYITIRLKNSDCSSNWLSIE